MRLSKPRALWDCSEVLTAHQSAEQVVFQGPSSLIFGSSARSDIRVWLPHKPSGLNVPKPKGRCLHYLATQTAHSCSGSVGCLCFCKDWWLCSISWSQMEDEVVRSRWGALPATFLYLQIDTQSAQRNSSITSKAGGFLPLFPQSTPKVYVPFRDSFLLESQPSFHFVPQDFLPWVPHTPFLWKRAPKQAWT